MILSSSMASVLSAQFMFLPLRLFALLFIIYFASASEF